MGGSISSNLYRKGCWQQVSTGRLFFNSHSTGGSYYDSITKPACKCGSSGRRLDVVAKVETPADAERRRLITVTRPEHARSRRMQTRVILTPLPSTRTWAMPRAKTPVL